MDQGFGCHMSKQAVLLIHGIGEQRPMETLRSFVKTVWQTDKSIQLKHPNAGAMWSKPYPLAEDFELRRLTTPENTGRIRTDFFELYWAHLMQGTKFGHLIGWARALLLRHPATVPKQLRLAYGLCIVLIGAGLVMAYYTAALRAAGHVAPFWISLTLTLFVIPAVTWVLLNIVGDAARYLHVAPENVECRRAIRSMGVKVLTALHERGYDRIIVVGHSLGAVIGYDILHHTWASFNEDRPSAPTPAYVALTALESLAAKMAATGDATPAVKNEEWRAAQRAYGCELKNNGVRWRVSDFITLGSPLTHAPILMARDVRDLAAKCADREFATCPPTLESAQRDHHEVWGFSYPAAQTPRVPHHAAVFGPTRWTNLYFPCSGIIRGDLIGGPAQAVFGPGILDVPVTTHLWGGFLSHTLYWSSGRKSDTHVEELRKVLDLAQERA